MSKIVKIDEIQLLSHQKDSKTAKFSSLVNEYDMFLNSGDKNTRNSWTFYILMPLDAILATI